VPTKRKITEGKSITKTIFSPSIAAMSIATIETRKSLKYLMVMIEDIKHFLIHKLYSLFCCHRFYRQKVSVILQLGRYTGFVGIDGCNYKNIVKINGIRDKIKN